jgi:XTP/dITP diphosphohydrolase
MEAILNQLLGGWRIRTLRDYPEFPEPEETAETYAGNAEIKARSAAERIPELCIADDAGLEIDALGGAPGVHSKRFEGADRPFAEKIGIILERMKGAQERSARFRCCVAIAKTDSPTRIFEAVKEGRIAEAPRGERGFGYDPIFIAEDDMTYAQMEPSHKNEISHRAIVLRQAAHALSAENIT